MLLPCYELHDVGVALKGRMIIKGLTFTTTAPLNRIIGQNGSGKTTLCQVLAGLLKPVLGTVFYNGQSLNEASYRRILRLHFGGTGGFIQDFQA